jgi:hypothetical protein
LIKKLLKMKRTNHELVRQIIHEGQKRGEFRKNIDVSLLMATMIGTCNHVVTSQEFYRELNGLQDLSQPDFEKHLKKKLSHHLKIVFKAILTHQS